MLLNDLVLLLGSTMRATRVVVTDDLGLWLFRLPGYRWAKSHGAGSWQAKLNLGLDCPFCVGFWIGTANLASYLIARRSPALLAAWRFGAGAFALNEVAAHLGSRLGDTAPD